MLSLLPKCPSIFHPACRTRRRSSRIQSRFPCDQLASHPMSLSSERNCIVIRSSPRAITTFCIITFPFKRESIRRIITSQSKTIRGRHNVNFCIYIKISISSIVCDRRSRLLITFPLSASNTWIKYQPLKAKELHRDEKVRWTRIFTG